MSHCLNARGRCRASGRAAHMDLASTGGSTMIGGTLARRPCRLCRKAVDECESGSWMALFPVFDSSAPRFVGIAVSTNLFRAHEGELFHLSCTMRLSSTMTRLMLNRNARARRANTQEARPLWAGKSSANASASLRGQQGEPARGEGGRNLGSPNSNFGERFSTKSPKVLPC